jgi:hypothetical protein
VRIPASLRGAGSSVVIVLLSASAVTLPTDAVERAVFEQNYDPLEALSRDIFDRSLRSMSLSCRKTGAT